MDEEDEKEFVSLANEFVQKCNLNVRVEKSSDCKDEFFVSLYQGLVGDNLKGLIANPLNQDEHVHNCQCVIDGLSQDVLNVDLSHISAEGIINGDIISIRNLLEIFSGLLEYFMECIDEDPSDLEDDFNDSNAMTAQHDVISSVLKEEFGSSYKDVKMKDSTTMEQLARNKAQSGPPLSSSSFYDRGNHSTITNTRMSTDPASFRTSTFTASGHEADVSEVSDSTNELIKLGESSSSSSRNSTLRKMTATSKSLSKDNGLQQGPAKTTWKHSMLSNNGAPQDLTQYSMSSDEGDKDSLPDNKNGSDNLSSSLVSSTSSWRQQISPLDADNDGIILDTLGVRPKVDSSLVAVAAKDSSEDGGSGRSTPVLHHHYHHHYHHPVGSDSKVHKTATSTSTHCSTDNFQDYTKYPGNVKSSAVGAPPTNNVGSHALAQKESILPGQTIGVTDYSTYTTRAGLPGKSTRSDGIPGVAGQSTRTDIPSVSFLDSARRGVDLPGQATKTSIASEYSNEDTRFPGQTIGSYAKPSVPLSEYSIPTNGLPEKTTKTSIHVAPEYSNEATRFPGQTISSYATSSVPLSEYSRPTNGLPGQSTISDIASSSFPNYTSPRSGAPLSDYSRLETGTSVTGQSTTSGTTSKAFTDYPTSVPSLAGQSQTRMSSVPLSDYSRLGTGVTGKSTAGGATGRAFTEYSTRGSGLPGPSHTSSGLTSGVSSRLGAGITGQTTSSGLGQRSLLDRYLPRGTSSTLPPTHVTSIPGSSGLHTVSSIPGSSGLHTVTSIPGSSGLHTVSSIPGSSGLHTVSSGGLTDSVFTGTGTSDLRKKFQPPITKSLDTKQTKEFEEREKSQVDATQDMVSTQRPSKFHDKSVIKVAPLKNQEAHEDMDVDSLGSDDDSDDDGARYSDSAIDYSRGGIPDDSESESEDSILRRIHDRWKTLKTRQSSQPKPVQRAVTFNEDIETIPITGRMDRLRRLLENEADEQRQQATAIRDAYAEQLQDIQKQQQQERKGMKKRKVQRSPLVPKKKAKKPIPVKQRGRLEAIYRPQGRLGRAPKRRPVKSRKRSASASPDIGRRRKTNTDVHETLLPSLFEEFPFLHVSPQTTHAMWQKQARQISLLSKPESAAKKTKGQRNVEEAEKRQERLLKVLRKELEYNQRMRGEREREDHQRAVKVKVNEKRQVAARARRYYDEYQLRMRSKMLKRRTREEQILKRLFDDGLEIQKQRVRELRKYAKEKTETLEQKQTNEIVSLENYYKDQFSMLAEGMTRERHELKVRQQAQEKVMGQMRRELRKKMEKEIQDLQETLTRDEDSAYFRQLEADRLRREFQLAMYKSDH